MKNPLRRFLWYLVLTCFLGCVELQEISVSDIEVNEPEIKETSNIKTVISAYKQSEQVTFTFDKNDKSILVKLL